MNNIFDRVVLYVVAVLSLVSLFLAIKGNSVTNGHLGAFISSPSGFTDIAVTNDATVGNNLTVTGVSTFNGSVVGIATSTLTSLTVTNVTSTNAAITGQLVVSGTAAVNQSVSSTLAVGGLAKTGCSAYGDASSSTLINYVTYASGVQTVTTTKPSICR